MRRGEAGEEQRFRNEGENKVKENKIGNVLRRLHPSLIIGTKRRHMRLNWCFFTFTAMRGLDGHQGHESTPGNSWKSHERLVKCICLGAERFSGILKDVMWRCVCV